MIRLEILAARIIRRALERKPVSRTVLHIDEVLEALAHDKFKALRNYGDRWGIAHVSFDGVSIAEIFDADLDRLITTWLTVLEALEAHATGGEGEPIDASYTLPDGTHVS